jgi:hypothetical protein
MLHLQKAAVHIGSKFCIVLHVVQHLTRLGPWIPLAPTDTVFIGSHQPNEVSAFWAAAIRSADCKAPLARIQKAVKMGPERLTAPKRTPYLGKGHGVNDRGVLIVERDDTRTKLLAPFLVLLVGGTRPFNFRLQMVLSCQSIEFDSRMITALASFCYRVAAVAILSRHAAVFTVQLPVASVRKRNSHISHCVHGCTGAPRLSFEPSFKKKWLSRGSTSATCRRTQTFFLRI